MTANKAKTALTLSVTLVLAACGGGGGGGGSPVTPTQPPAGFGDFNGSFTLRGTNPAGADFSTSFDDLFPANFVNGEAIVGTPPNNVATKFDYPLQSQGSGCYYERGAIDTCAERATGRVLALCSASSDAELNSVGISDTRDGSFNTATLNELISAADAANDQLQLRSLNCAGALDANDTVTVLIDGNIIQRFGTQQGTLTPSNVLNLFSAQGLSAGNPETRRSGAQAFKQTVGGVVTYYVVTYAADNAQGQALPPKVFVSGN